MKGSQGLVSILPYLEQQPLYDQFDHNMAFTNFPGRGVANSVVVGDTTIDSNLNGFTNAALAEIVLSVYRCASDPASNQPADALRGFHYGPGGSFTGAKTNYDFCTDSGFMFANHIWRQANRGSIYNMGRPSQRMFGWESKCSLTDVQDGASNTIMMSEITQWVGNGQGAAWAYRGWVMCGGDPAAWDNRLRGGINVWHQPWITPTWRSPPWTPTRGRGRSWWCHVGSLHPGGCQFTMADGSVQFIGQTIEFDTLMRLAMMRDGLPVQLNQ
jgi:prepilin-type processing-associated H-X9-DG protein